MVETRSTTALGNVVQKTRRVRVKPANEDIRKHILHPAGRIAFRETVDQSVEWPNDAFTKRRIIEGDVILVEDASAEQSEPQPRRRGARSDPPPTTE